MALFLHYLLFSFSHKVASLNAFLEKVGVLSEFGAVLMITFGGFDRNK